MDSLPVNERIQRYRQLAIDAFRKAHAATDPELRASRLAEATAWHGLAAEVERNTERVSPPAGAGGEAEETQPKRPPKH